ncbi:MAG: aminoglycoside phosphotransferase family protein [Planctomycetota bacterium]
MQPSSRPEPTPPAEIAAWLSSKIGPVAAWRNRSWPLGVCAVWEASFAAGDTCFLKVHAQPRKFLQERTAYRDWIPRLPPKAPTLLGASDELLALALRSCTGCCLESAQLSVADELRAYREAGEFLRALHELPLVDRDPVPVAAALHDRLASWCHRGRDWISQDLRAWAFAVLEPNRWFAGLRRVACHRDYQPRNWLVETRTEPLTWTVIDFEHSGADLWLVDFLKLWDRPWVERADRERAFFLGYGADLTDLDRERLTRLGVLHAIATTTWAREHGDRAYEAHGRHTLARLQHELQAG